jgi:hypothetical protein
METAEKSVTIESDFYVLRAGRRLRKGYPRIPAFFGGYLISIPTRTIRFY